MKYDHRSYVNLECDHRYIYDDTRGPVTAYADGGIALNFVLLIVKYEPEGFVKANSCFYYPYFSLTCILCTYTLISIERSVAIREAE